MSVSLVRNLLTHELGEDIIARRDFGRLDEVYARDVINHGAIPRSSPGLAGVHAHWQQMHASFSDFKIASDLVCAFDDHVTFAYRLYGPHTGDFLWNEASGKRFSVQGVRVARFNVGLIVESWGCTDVHSILDQLDLPGRGPRSRTTLAAVDALADEVLAASRR